MRFEETTLADARLVKLELKQDARGFFARAWCEREFRAAGLVPRIVQINVSGTERAGTIRGMHYQIPPAAEVKVVRCVSGAVYDVIVDLRPDSPTFLRWESFELSKENRWALYIPAGFAHGFQTLSDGVELLYLHSEFHAPSLERGIRHDDPALGIEWPLPVSVVSEKDQAWPSFAADDSLRGMVGNAAGSTDCASPR